jgi:hypothetical protein
VADRGGETRDYYGTAHTLHPDRVTPGCDCEGCRFHTGREGGVPLVMCDQNWRKLTHEQRVEITESVND